MAVLTFQVKGGLRSSTLNPFIPRVSYGDFKVILTSESVDEILWCDHSNENLVSSTFTWYSLYLLPRVSYGDFKVILTSESVDEILWCDHSNENLVSSTFTWYSLYLLLYKVKFDICLEG